MRNQMTGVMKHWQVLYDGGSGTWLYARKVRSGRGSVFFMLEIIDMVDACGRDANFLFCGDLSIVEPGSASWSTIRSALDCVGLTSEDINDARDPEMALAEVLFQYGAKSPMYSEEGGKITEKSQWGRPGESHPEFRRLRAVCRREAEGMIERRDGEYWLSSAGNSAMDTRVVNRMGQTAREFAGGSEGLWDTLRRIQGNPDATADQKLILRMYQNAGQTLGCGPVPADIREGA